MEPVRMSRYKQLTSDGTREITRRGTDRAGNWATGVERVQVPGQAPIGLEIQPYEIELRGNRFLCRIEQPNDVPFHFVRVYADGHSERI